MQLSYKLPFLLLIFLLSFSYAHAKEWVVLLPLDILSNDLSEQQGNSLGNSLQEGLLKRYSVYYGSDVEKAIEKETSKVTCTQEQCIQGVANAFGTELIAEAEINGGKAGFIITYKLTNIVSSEVIESKTVPCQSCSIFKLISVMKKLGANTLKDKDIIVENAELETMKITFTAYDEKTSNPISGVQISIGNELIGVTPLTIPMKEGIYQLGVTNPLYSPIKKTIEITPVGSVATSEIKIPLSPIFGTLSAKIEPAGNGKIQFALKGTTYKETHPSPIDKLKVPPGDYLFTLSAPGYQTVERKIVIKEQEVLKLTETLDKKEVPTKFNYNILAGVVFGSDSGQGLEFGIEIEPEYSAGLTLFPLAFRLFFGRDNIDFKISDSIEIPSGELTAKDANYITFEYKPLMFGKFALGIGAQSLTLPEDIEYINYNEQTQSLPGSASTVQYYASPSFNFNIGIIHIDLYYRWIAGSLVQPVQEISTGKQLEASANLSRIGINFGISL
jgi:hypothetical protein